MRTSDPEPECWLSRTTKQFTPSLLRWPRISQKRCSEPGWLRTDTARWYSSQNIYCESHAVWEEAELNFCRRPWWVLPPLLLASVIHWVTHGLSLQGFLSLNQPPLWHSSERCPMSKEVLTAFLGEWPCLTFHVM